MSDATGEDRLGPDDIRRVLDALDRSAWDEAVITVGDVTIAVARNGASLPGTAKSAGPADAATTAPPAVAPAPTSSAPAAPTPTPTPAPIPEESAPTEPGRPVASPSVGVFWRAPEPGAAPFVEVGQHVDAGQTLCIVEVMKLMSHVDAPVAGTVTAIHVDNATAVEHGDVLFTLAPDEG